MIIPIELRFKADKGSKSAFRTEKTIKSHDVNSVEFHISIDGLELTDNHTAKILSIFHSSKSQVNTDCEIVNGKIIYKPDTHLITRHEHVTNYVYVYKDNQSLDVREFIYVVDLSKIDETSLEVKEVYDQSYADLLADFEQALNDYKDSLPQADSVRADIDEILNQFSEDSQAKLSQYDADVQQVITDNQTAFGLAETGRQDSYVQAEDIRNQASSQAVADWKQGADALLETVEGNESARAGAEATRETAETDRVSSESTRKTNETTRISNEDARKSAEVIRLASEVDRVNAEAQRKTDHANRSAEMDGKADKVVLSNFLNPDMTYSKLGVTYTVSDGVIDAKVDESSGSLRGLFISLGDTVQGHLYFLSVDGMFSKEVRTSIGNYNDRKSVDITKLNTWETITLTTMRGVQATFTWYFNMGSTQTGDGFKLRNLMLIDLTETFGAGNEPTAEEMAELIKVTGYIDGEYALNNKEMLDYLMKGVREKANKKQEEWITPTLLNGWTNRIASTPVRFRKNEFGRVEIEGAIKGGTLGVPAFVLPQGYETGIYQPKVFGALNYQGSMAEVTIMAGRNFTIVKSSNTVWISLEGISYEPN